VSRLLRLFGEPHFEAWRIEAVSVPFDAALYRRVWRWRTPAVLLALLAGFLAGALVGWR